MRDCADAAMRDQLPLLATGRLTDTEAAAVEAHIVGCADCAAEMELLRAVGRAYAVPALEAATIAAAIPAPPKARRLAYYQQPMWRIAAAMTLMIVGAAGVLVVKRADPGALDAVASTDSGAAGGAAASAESTLALAPTAPVGTATISFGGNLADLTDAQLEALLSQIETIDGSVSSEPTALTTAIPPAGTDGTGRRN